jgi:hypothetical protein
LSHGHVLNRARHFQKEKEALTLVIYLIQRATDDGSVVNVVFPTQDLHHLGHVRPTSNMANELYCTISIRTIPSRLYIIFKHLGDAAIDAVTK